MKKKRAEPVDPFPICFETFRDPQYYAGQMREVNPSCFNGKVSVEKYRVTIERVEEPREVIAARIKELWDNCDNPHHWQPLRSAAAKVGMTLDHATIKPRENR